MRTNGADVVAITETWLHQGIMDTEILDSSYVIFRRDRQQGQRGGGVLLCLKSDFLSVRRRDLEMDEVEAVVCEISDINNSKMIIAVFYRPPNMDSGYLQNVVNIFYKIYQSGTNIFILGDFNFPSINWSNYSSSSNFDSIFIECPYDCFWSQLINVPTRMRRHQTSGYQSSRLPLISDYSITRLTNNLFLTYTKQNTHFYSSPILSPL